jgi:hypothetical protein
VVEQTDRSHLEATFRSTSQRSKVEVECHGTQPSVHAEEDD